MYGVFFINSEHIRDGRITIQIYYGEENYVYGVFFINSEHIRDGRITIQIYYGEENYVYGVFSINSEEEKKRGKKTVEIYYHTPNNDNVRIWKALLIRRCGHGFICFLLLGWGVGGVFVLSMLLLLFYKNVYILLASSMGVKFRILFEDVGYLWQEVRLPG